jgi:hypothetical protein
MKTVSIIMIVIPNSPMVVKKMLIPAHTRS